MPWLRTRWLRLAAIELAAKTSWWLRWTAAAVVRCTPRLTLASLAKDLAALLSHAIQVAYGSSDCAQRFGMDRRLHHYCALISTNTLSYISGCTPLSLAFLCAGAELSGHALTSVLKEAPPLCDATPILLGRCSANRTS